MKRHIIPIATLLLLAAASRAQAEDTNAAPGTNIPVAAQSAPDTNAPAALRRTATTDAPAPAAGNSTPRFSNFQVIVDRNIFNANRSGGRIRQRGAPPSRVDSFALLGTMSYEKGRFAFFDGSGSDFHKTLKPADKIAGYTVADIGYDRVKLAASNSQPVELCIGMQMKSLDGGPWSLSEKTELPAASDTNTASTALSAIDDKSEIVDSPTDDLSTKALKRLMKKRKKELSK